MARTEEQMTEELTGMAAPAEGMPMEEEAPEMKYDMESMVGNYLDMEESDRKKVLSLVASPVTRLLDTLLGEPVLERFSMQIEKEIPAGEPMAEGEAEPMPEGEGMMAPTTEEEPAPLV